MGGNRVESCDLLIVGAGPTGLMMASECARYGMDCRIIDRASHPSDHSKALAIQPRSLEMLHFLGIDSPFLERGEKLHALSIHSQHRLVGHVEFQKLNSPFPYILSLPQSVTEELLNQHLIELGLKIERECELIGLEEQGEEVLATIQTPGNQKKQLRAQWVIGCDGAHSFVRKHLNLSFEGKTFPIVFSLADVQINWKYSHEEANAFWSREGILAAIPLPEKGRYRLIFELDRCQQHQEKAPSLNHLQVGVPPPTLEEVKEVVWKRADPDAHLTDPVWLANFHVNSRLGNHYQVRRFFLAGDAIHIHSPIGGQGMNTGLQDGWNLAWKLAFVHKGYASPHLLKSYHEERHATATKLLEGTEEGTRMAALQKGWQIFLRNGAASLLLRFSSLQQTLIEAISQINITYSPSSFIAEKGRFSRGPKSGSRMPDFTLQEGKEPRQLHALLQGIDTFFVLFLLGDGYDFEELGKLLLQLDQLSLPIKPLLLAKGSVGQKFDRLFVDLNGGIHSALGVEKNGAYVIRPDTYIGYRQAPLNPQALLAYFERY